MSNRVYRSLVLLAIALTMGSQLLYGEVTAGVLGTVVDPSGATPAKVEFAVGGVIGVPWASHPAGFATTLPEHSPIPIRAQSSPSK